MKHAVDPLQGRLFGPYQDIIDATLKSHGRRNYMKYLILWQISP